jgi:hypothetical protein
MSIEKTGLNITIASDKSNTKNTSIYNLFSLGRFELMIGGYEWM